jgi:formyl-CoA transferase
VNTVAELKEDDHFKAREMIVEIEHPTIGRLPLPGVLPKLSRTPGQVRTCAPAVGEHNRDIYCGMLGLDEAQYARLREQGTI